MCMRTRSTLRAWIFFGCRSHWNARMVVVVLPCRILPRAWVHARLSRDAAKPFAMTAERFHWHCVEQKEQNIVFSSKAAAAGNKSSFVQQVRLRSWFLVASGVFLCSPYFACMGLPGCRSRWYACMIVVFVCCQVRQYMRVDLLMLQNAL